MQCLIMQHSGSLATIYSSNNVFWSQVKLSKNAWHVPADCPRGHRSNLHCCAWSRSASGLSAISMPQTFNPHSTQMNRKSQSPLSPCITKAWFKMLLHFFKGIISLYFSMLESSPGVPPLLTSCSPSFGALGPERSLNVLLNLLPGTSVGSPAVVCK